MQYFAFELLFYEARIILVKRCIYSFCHLPYTKNTIYLNNFGKIIRDAYSYK